MWNWLNSGFIEAQWILSLNYFCYICISTLKSGQFSYVTLQATIQQVQTQNDHSIMKKTISPINVENKENDEENRYCKRISIRGLQFSQIYAFVFFHWFSFYRILLIIMKRLGKIRHFACTYFRGKMKTARKENTNTPQKFTTLTVF